MSDRIAIMKDGRIIQTGAPGEIYARPANRFVASFMGEVNILAVNREGADGAFADFSGPAPAKAGRFAVIRPEALRPGEGEFSGELTVAQRLMLGSRTQLILESRSGESFVAELGGTAQGFQPGTRQRFGFAARDIAWVEE